MKFRLKVLILLVVVCLTCSGCRIEFSWTFEAEKALTMGQDAMTEGEIRVISLEYKCLFESYYKELLGSDFWDRTSLNSVRFEEHVKTEYILEEARALLFLNSVAPDLSVSLTDSEKEEIRLRAETYMDHLSDDERSFLSSDVKTVERVMRRYEIAAKSVARLLQDYKLEVSDEESRVLDVMVIRVSDRALADELIVRIRNGENFAMLSGIYSEDEVIEYSVARSELESDVADVLFSLKDGEISDVFEFKGSYYIFRNINSYNLLLSNKEKNNLLAARRYENWDRLFDAYAKKNEEKIRYSFWENLRLNTEGDFPYCSLFS